MVEVSAQMNETNPDESSADLQSAGTGSVDATGDILAPTAR
jgi:hypothetical protein